MQSKIKLEGKFSETTIQYQDKYLEIYLFKQQLLEKQLLIKAKEILITYEILDCNQLVKEEYLSFLTKAIKRTYNEVKTFIEYIYNLNICQEQSTKGFENVTYICGTQLVNNKQNSQKEHIPFAFFEKQGQPDEAY
ncbi:1-phosphatidylinositol 3-phosphate 5-kinase-like: PROVISIONAL [Gigaspora margarita]|uniref:1-phosphatidylinositol 3-phosphate 5-kinase-like: PROVISIONAL n=1 Tax=Gigaspora margarita TaxID=4874 RepID=A0A8H4A5Y7_GIGMA|nr:1-phosphatidylinositol 3-phosphate 5-kinase-like: PROVISIONAL [Gigaspora margarita]